MAGSSATQAEGSKAPHQLPGGSDIARMTFELNNDIKTVDPTDALFAYSRENEKILEDGQPWKKE